MSNIKIRVLQRLKDNLGETYAYRVKVNNNKETKIVSPDDLRKNTNNIVNAIVTKDGNIKAKNGYKIETICKKQELPIINTKQQYNKNGEQYKGECYGKEYINICKKIRNYASSGKIEVETTKHKSNAGNNIHLFRLIEECGFTVSNFVKAYLSVIQPYSLQPFMPGKTRDNKDLIWMVDAGYNVKLIIKINESDKDKVLVVSFHESNINGKSSLGRKTFKDKKCAVLIDNDRLKYTDENSGQNVYKVEYTVQRGFMRLHLTEYTPYVYNGIAYVNGENISNSFLDRINTIFKNFANNFETENSLIDEISFNNISNISFLSFGSDIINVLCQIIDLYSTYTGVKQRAFLIGVAGNIIEELPDYRYNNVKEALESKFSGLTSTNNTLYINIINALDEGII